MNLAHSNTNYGSISAEPTNYKDEEERELLNIQNSPKGKQSKKSSQPHQYGSFVAYCFCVNYILGVGVLGRFI